MEGFVGDGCIGEGKGDGESLMQFENCGGINGDGGGRK